MPLALFCVLTHCTFHVKHIRIANNPACLWMRYQGTKCNNLLVCMPMPKKKRKHGNRNPLNKLTTQGISNILEGSAYWSTAPCIKSYGLLYLHCRWGAGQVFIGAGEEVTMVSGQLCPLCQKLWVGIEQVYYTGWRASLYYRRGSDGLSSRMMEPLGGRSSLLFQLLRYARWGVAVFPWKYTHVRVSVKTGTSNSI